MKTLQERVADMENWLTEYQHIVENDSRAGTYRAIQGWVVTYHGVVGVSTSEYDQSTLLQFVCDGRVYQVMLDQFCSERSLMIRAGKLARDTAWNVKQTKKFGPPMKRE